MYADIAHPINQACRDQIQNAVIREYSVELDRAKQPDYKSRYDDEYVESTQSDLQSQSPASSAESSSVPKPHFLDAEKKNSTNQANSLDKRNFGDGVF